MPALRTIKLEVGDFVSTLGGQPVVKPGIRARFLDTKNLLFAGTNKVRAWATVERARRVLEKDYPECEILDP